MSKADGWEKQDCGWEWRKPIAGFRAEIAKVSGGGIGRPFHWSVYPLPRPAKERWMPIAKGTEPSLAAAKAKVDAALSARD